MEKQQEHFSKSPFKDVVIGPDQKLKVWDVVVPANNEFLVRHADEISQGFGTEGRVRILAVCPKKPLPLTNIKFSVAWCSPLDMKKFTKYRANQMIVGRWLKAFRDEHLPVYNVGTVDKVETLKNFPSVVFKQMEVEGQLPWWVEPQR